jgi:5-methylcytosine-specific restriction protein A
MARLQSLRSQLSQVPARLNPVPAADRQQRRQYATNSAEWRAIRQQVLLRDNYTCRACGRTAGGKGEAHVDHIDGDSGNNPEDGSNWQTLCAPCHSAKTAREDGGFGNRKRT